MTKRFNSHLHDPEFRPIVPVEFWAEIDADMLDGMTAYFAGFEKFGYNTTDVASAALGTLLRLMAMKEHPRSYASWIETQAFRLSEHAVALNPNLVEDFHRVPGRNED